MLWLGVHFDKKCSLRPDANKILKVNLEEWVNKKAHEKSWCKIFAFPSIIVYFNEDRTEQSSYNCNKPTWFTFCSLSSALLILWFTWNWHRSGLWLITWSDIVLSIDEYSSIDFNYPTWPQVLFAVRFIVCGKHPILLVVEKRGSFTYSRFMLKSKEIFVWVDDGGDKMCCELEVTKILLHSWIKYFVNSDNQHFNAASTIGV